MRVLFKEQKAAEFVMKAVPYSEKGRRRVRFMNFAQKSSEYDLPF
jgi:hypothetical protein